MDTFVGHVWSIWAAPGLGMGNNEFSKKHGVQIMGQTAIRALGAISWSLIFLVPTIMLMWLLSLDFSVYFRVVLLKELGPEGITIGFLVKGC